MAEQADIIITKDLNREFHSMYVVDDTDEWR